MNDFRDCLTTWPRFPGAGRRRAFFRATPLVTVLVTLVLGPRDLGIVKPSGNAISSKLDRPQAQDPGAGRHHPLRP
jgi:hypothetical protein